MDEPKAAPAAEKEGGWYIPKWALSTILAAIFSVASAAAVVWRNDTVQDNYIAYLMRNDERKSDQIAEIASEVSNQRGELSHLKTDQAHFQGLVIDKIDTLLVTDRFRKKW